MESPNLEVLDLEGNELTDPIQLDFLSGCKRLRAVTLCRNPISRLANYRAHLIYAGPESLAYIDDEIVAEEERICERSESINGPYSLVELPVTVSQSGGIADMHIQVWIPVAISNKDPMIS